MRIVLLTSALLFAGVTAAGAQPAIGHPTAPSKVVLRVTVGGGFVPVQANLRQLPSFTLYGDGTAVVPGAVPQIFPGPAIAPLVSKRLSERQVQALLRRAREAGLLARGAIDYGDMGSVGVSDAPTTTLLISAAGRRVRRDAYALGIGAGAGRLSAKQAKARGALARFIAGLPAGPAGGRHVPHAIAVYAVRSTSPAPAGAGRVVWPLERNLATAGKRISSGLGYRCITVAGKDAKTLLARLRGASEQSRWVMRGRPQPTYELVVRPLLPDEPGCPAANP